MPFSTDDSTTDEATAAIPVPAPTGDAGEAPEQPPWRVGSRYRVVDRLGSGGMADVFRAHDELLARDVAVKVFRAQPQAPETETSANRQLAELHALARLNHPNLITLFDGSISEGEGPAYLVMELVDGSTLADRIAEGALPPHEAAEVGAQIAAALSYVHAQGMVHRDVKPANILLGVDRTGEGATPRARLSDFGIVRLLGTERMTSVDFTMGTASYLAPEQARGADLGPPADVYSLGLVLIEALSGTRSFDGTPLEAALARLERDPEMPADLPPAWTSLLAAMTAREPSARPSAAQVAQMLRDGAATTAAVPLLADADGATQALRLPGAAMAAAVATPMAERFEDDDYVEPQRGGHGRMFAWLAAAAVALAAIVVGGVMVLRPSTPADSKTPATTPSVGAPTSAAGKPTKARSGTSAVSDTSSSASASRSASSSAATSASTSASASKASAPATSSTAARPAPSTSAGTTSAAPPTSVAATSPAAATSAATSATNAAASSPAVAAPSGP